jgi:hypothetical protein
MTTLVVAALDYLRRGWRPLPIMPGQKRPALANWPELIITAETCERYFSRGEGLGIILGRRSGDLVDIDLDCSEAIELADIFLPLTNAEFGRASKPRSHRLYTANDIHKTAFSDPITGATLLELRTDGRDGAAHQTVFPPSLHPSGECIAWTHANRDPRACPGPLLVRLAAELAIACLFLRYVGPPAGGVWHPDTIDVLWEFDPELARPAYHWLDRSTPDAPRRHLRPRHELSRREIDLVDIVAAIPNHADWEDWNKIGMAIWAASNGSNDGFVLFDAFSARSPKYQPQAVVERWRNYTRGRPGRIGMGTLVHLARQAGWSRSV